MNTNTVETISTTLQTLGAVARQIESQPLSVILIIFLFVLGSLLKLVFTVFRNVGHQMESEGIAKPGKLVRIFSASLIQLIPIWVVMAGCKSNQLISDPGKVAQCPDPQFVIGMFGICLALVSWGIHALFGKRLEKFIPLLSGKPENGDLNGPEQLKEPPK